MKAQAACAVLGEYTIEHQRVRMDIQIERRPEALDDDDGAAAPVHYPVRVAGPPPEEPKDRAHEDPDHRPTQGMVPGEPVADARGQRQDPLPDRDLGKHVVDEMRGALRHPPAAATRTHRAPFAREGDQAIETAPVTLEPREPAGEESTAQEALELLQDEPRQAVALPRTRRLRAEGLEMLAHHLIEDTLRRRPGLVARGQSGHASRRREGHTTAPSVVLCGNSVARRAEAASRRHPCVERRAG
jgi:hypothetical protein